MKIKQLFCIFLCFALLAVCAGCSGRSEDPDNGQKIAEETQVDVDLTKLSSTMVYSEVYNMMTTPEKYIGKVVKMSGKFSVYHDAKTDKNYFAVLISDATACCSQGIEFVWNGNHSYPEDYPALGKNITVTGVFGTYKEGSQTYCQLTSDKVEFQK